MCSTSSIDPVRWLAGRAAARWMLADRALKAVVADGRSQEAEFYMDNLSVTANP